jgi:nitronate monooxygenase
MLSTRFTELVGCVVPLQQAGMGGVAGVELAGAVAAAGGLGMIGAVGLPAAELSRQLDSVDAGPGAVGVNFLMPFLDPESVTVAGAKSSVVEFFYDAPRGLLVDSVH